MILLWFDYTLLRILDARMLLWYYDHSIDVAVLIAGCNTCDTCDHGSLRRRSKASHGVGRALVGMMYEYGHL